MEQNSGCNSNNYLWNESKSLGILNMDNLNAFGDVSYDSFKNCNNSAKESKRIINDRLNNERMKALESLRKSQNSGIFKKPHPANYKEKSKGAINIPSNNSPMQLDHTDDYVPFRRPNTINISDLVTDETINLEISSSCPSLTSKDVKVSFEPTEITGRSTLYNNDVENQKSIIKKTELGAINNEGYKTKNISVNDILASSFAPKARNLCETLQIDGATLDSNLRMEHGTATSRTSSSFSSFNDYRSLPRTVDMSLAKNTCTEESFNRGTGTFSFSSAAVGTGFDESEGFVPGELMQSKLIDDEISWAQQYATIPGETLSKEAKAKVVLNSGISSNGFDSPSTTNSIIAGDPNFSVGNFFYMRSDNVWNILKSKSPDKCNSPITLVDDEDNTVTTTSDLEGSSKISLKSKVDSKTYTSLGTFATQTELSQYRKHESKDSGNSTDNAYLLSISAIDRALCNLDVQSNASVIGETEQFNGNENVMATEEMILANKENLDPKTKLTAEASALCDTMSFRESLLNTSDMKSLQRSITQSRSPLSPIDVSAPNIRINITNDDGEEADNDEWPDTPIATNRRIRRTKSPRDKSPFKNNANVSNDDSIEVKTPVNTHCTLKNKNKSETKTKSLSSTRLDGGDVNPQADCDFGISPNISNSHHSSSTLVVRRNTLCLPQAVSPKIGSPSPANNSPMSSPRSCHSYPRYSPTSTASEFRSPNLDATSNSDRQLLSAGPVAKILGSPVGSEVSSACSYGTIKSYRSAISGGSVRSVSRCSSSSEFSHRDGKQIPIKVTNTELSWGSIKLRSNSRKSMQIKNIINKRLVIRIEVSGPGYQIVNSQRSNTITLHSQECRTISICFCPTVPGVAIGTLSFYAPGGVSTIGSSFLEIPLYGYGGNASIIAQNISIGPVGSPFVTMGDVCELAHPLERTVSFYNKGPLVGFASVTIDSIGLMLPRLSDVIEIHPRQFLIPPKHVVHIRIVFRPKREEIRKIIKKFGSVLTLANMRVICGDEANRQRIRRLLSQMSGEERCKLSSTSLDLLWNKFPHELEMADLIDIKENPSVSMDLTSFFRIHEILLTINHDNMDDTFESTSLFLADIDETVLFRTVCAAADSPTPCSNLGTVDEILEEVDDERVAKATNPLSWSVTPETLVINLNKQVAATLCVHNGFKSRQFFEVVCNLKDIFHFAPSDGYVASDGGQTDINISLHAKFQHPSENVFIMVYMENERIIVPVNFIK